MQASDQGQLRVMLTPHYVQTDLYGTFEEVKFDLENGMPVLYIAAPCQLDGLLAYLGKGKYTGLSIMELPCFGAASPGLWEKYSKACAVAETALGSSGDPYMSLFIQGMNLRPSCYRCPVRRDFTRPDRIGRPEEMPEKRSDFFKGYHSATDISKYMKRYVRNPITIFLTRIFTGGKQI